MLQESARLEREHLDLMEELERCPISDINERARLQTEAERTLMDLKAVEATKYQAMLKDEHLIALRKRDFDKAENILRQMRELDKAAQSQTGAGQLRPSVEEILKLGNKTDLVVTNYLKELSQKDRESVQALLEEEQLDSDSVRRESIEGCKFKNVDLKRWDKGEHLAVDETVILLTLSLHHC